MDWSAEFLEWAWARHHNVWSWYIRPLIILAFCWAAYKRSLFGVVALALFFPLSAIVFPPPETPNPDVVRFLAQERALLEALSPVGLAAFIVLVIVFLSLLAAAFWTRSFWIGLLVANLGSLAKLLVSLWLWPETGTTIAVPTILTVIVFNGVALTAWRIIGKKYPRQKNEVHGEP